MAKTAVFIFAAIASILIAGCSSPQKTVQINFTTLKGVSLSPSSFDQNGMTDFYSRAKVAGTIITWAGKWDQFVDDRSAPNVVAQLASVYGYKPVFITDIGDDEISSGLIQSRFADTVVSFAGKYKPDYLGLGNEVNLEYDKSPEIFAQKMEFYGRVYDEIKKVSPNTKVFTVYQLEKIKGRKGGLFGGTDTQPEWFLLNNASKFDVIAFTTYPSLVYKDPGDMPNDYYQDIRVRTAKPVAFTEVGWFHEGPAGWESSDQEQARFIGLFFAQNNRPEFVIWPFVYDQPVQKPFDKMGLISNSTVAYDAWVAA